MLKKIVILSLIFNLILAEFLVFSTGNYLIVKTKLRFYDYVMDKVEHFQSPEETIKRKKGDCDDFAILTNYWLKNLGYESEMYIAYFEDAAHAFTVFKDSRGTYRLFTSMYLSYCTSKDLSVLLDRYTTSLKSECGELKSIYVFNPHKYGKIEDVRKSLGKQIY
jgi:hypothetical protein